MRFGGLTSRAHAGSSWFSCATSLCFATHYLRLKFPTQLYNICKDRQREQETKRERERERERQREREREREIHTHTQSKAQKTSAFRFKDEACGLRKMVLQT